MPESEIVLELAEEFLARYRKGERPLVREYIARHPELADEIREVFPAMAMMEKIAIIEEPPVGRRQGGSLMHEQLGDYRIIREVGRGGMGIVYEAEQVSLGRHVALKVLPNTSLFNVRHQRRFEREARSAARLHHTNIVPVFGFGSQDGVPYYVMQFIQGLGMNEVLDEVIRQQGQNAKTVRSNLSLDLSVVDVAHSLLTGRFDASPATVDQDRNVEAQVARLSANSGVASTATVTLPGQSDVQAATKQNYWQSIANVGMQVASALDYAHNQGVLHRDIKPSNLLLDRHGTVWITDFGIAKTDNQENLTHTGEIVGTLTYIPPEAFEGNADRRGDVYSLGLTLYEMLAMRPAFAEEDRARLIREVMTIEPQRLNVLNPAIPRDLVTIIHKAIERNPAHRYATAADLAEDLSRFLADEPIQARPISAPERLWRWSRRRPAAAAAVGLAGLLVFALIALPLIMAIIKSAHATELGNQKTKVEEALKESRRQAAVLTLERALGVGEQGEVAHSLLHLVRGLKQAREAEASDLEEAFRWNLGAWSRENHELLHILTHGADVRAIAFSPDSKLIASGGADHQVRLWDAETGRPRGSPLAHPGQVQALAFHPQGRLLTGCEDGSARMWDVVTCTQVGPTLMHSPPNVDNRMKSEFPFHQGLACIAIRADGREIATGGYDGVALRWEYATGKRVGSSLPAPKGSITGLAYHPQGRYLVIAGIDRMWRLWDSANDNFIFARHTGSNIWGLAMDPRGARFATGLGQERGARQWDIPPVTAFAAAMPPKLPAGAESLRHYQAVTAVAYTPDAALLLTGSQDRTARLWDAMTGRPFGSSLQHRDWVQAVAVSPDNRLAVTGCRDGTARVWRIARGSRVHTFQHPGWVRGGPAFDAESRTILTGGEGAPNPRVYRWDVATGKQLASFTLPTSAGERWITGVAISPFGNSVYASDHARGIVHFWDAHTGRHLRSTEPHGDEVWRLTLSPDGRTLVTGTVGYKSGPGCGARLWDAASGRPIGTPLAHRGAVLGIAFRPDSKAVLTGSDDRTTRLWDAWTGEPLGPPLVHPNAIRSIAFQQDGLTVALGSADRTAQIWNPRTWKPIGPAMQHDGEVNSVTYNPRGDLLLTASTDFTARVWHIATGKSIGPAFRHAGDITSISCSPDGHKAATISDDRTAALWAMPVPVKDEPEQIWRWAQRITGLTLGDDGAFHVLSPEEVAVLRDAGKEFDHQGPRQRKVPPDIVLIKALGGAPVLQNVDELLEVAMFATQEKKLFAATATLYKDRFAAHADWLNAKVGSATTNRRFAAAVAAMAALGEGDARTLTAMDRTAWRNQAITWLHEEILAWNKCLTPRTASQIVRLLREVDDDKWLAPICAPANVEYRLAAERDAYRQLWAAAAAVSMEAFALDRALAQDMTAAYRYNAACHAIRASSGAGDPRDVIDEAQRGRLRKQALAWLRADLELWSKMAASDDAAERALLRTRLRHWQNDNDLSAIRREQAIATLPAEEADLCRQLWHDVAEILNKTQD